MWLYCTSTQYRTARKHVRGEHTWTCYVNCYIEFWPDNPCNKYMPVYSSWENGMFTITSDRSLIRMTSWLHCIVSDIVITWIQVSLACTQPLQCNYANSLKIQKIGLMCVWYFWIRIIWQNWPRSIFLKLQDTVLAKAALEWNPQGTIPRTTWRRTILDEIRHHGKTWK